MRLGCIDGAMNVIRPGLDLLDCSIRGRPFLSAPDACSPLNPALRHRQGDHLALPNLDADIAFLVHVNDGGVSRLEFPSEEFVGQPILDLVLDQTA